MGRAAGHLVFRVNTEDGSGSGGGGSEVIRFEILSLLFQKYLGVVHKHSRIMNDKVRT